MRWYVKSAIQNAMAMLPDAVAWPLYYQLQRNFGELKNPRFDMRFRAAADIAGALATHHDGIAGKTLLEVGTGRSVDVPMVLWLLGAGRVITVDLTHLLRAEIVDQSIRYLIDGWDEFRPLFAPHVDEALLDARFEALTLEARGGVGEADLPRLLRRLDIDYRSPADASRLDLPDGSVDAHFSFVVLQHVPRREILAILREGRRVLKQDGRMIHVANTGDHFAHVDPSLSPLHFLRYSERQWNLIAGNPFMYQNRMRADDYYQVFREAGLELVHTDELIDDQALSDRRAGIPLHPDFRGREPERDAVIRFATVLCRDDAEASS
ncbi:MAG: methyltransferase domain-containing protein [Polyangiaceae bacterium]